MPAAPPVGSARLRERGGVGTFPTSTFRLPPLDALLREYLPTAPDLGLYVRPDIPEGKLRAAIADYAPDVAPGDVVALYDATRLGSAKDGALFLADRLVFQNNDLQAARVIRYEDVVGVRAKRKLLGGREVEIDLNRGRATVTETLDFSGQPGAAEYVERVLQQILAQGVRPAPPVASGTDRRAVADALDRLVERGDLMEDDRDRMLNALG